MKIILIRHGKTAGNLEKRYIGITDEPLCDAGIKELQAMEYPDCERVISSGMKRCIETAKLIYPDKKIEICEQLNECDFGSFEGKNYAELSADPDYQKWLDSAGKRPFPNGGDPEKFKTRCTREFVKITQKFSENKTLAFVIHGGTIMSIMEKFAILERNFYDYQVENGHGFVAEFDGTNITKTENL